MMTFLRTREGIVAPLHTARGDCRVIEFAGLPGCGKTTVLDALRSRPRSGGIDRMEVRYWSDIYGASRLSRLPGRPDRYYDVFATTIWEPRLVLALWRRALAAGYPATEAARWVCHFIRMRRAMHTMRRRIRHNSATILLDSGICGSLTYLLHFGTAAPPPVPCQFVAAAMRGISDGLVYFESDAAECYARAIPRTGWEHAWMRDIGKEKMLNTFDRVNKDLRGLIDVVESIGIPTLRLPWDTTVDERVELIEQSLCQHHWGLAGTE